MTLVGTRKHIIYKLELWSDESIHRRKGSQDGDAAFGHKSLTICLQLENKSESIGFIGSA